MISKFSIAVLPFVNISPEQENEYFSDGISEEILNALSRLQGLHVTARTSSFAFKDQKIDVREIGRKLNVSLILEGSIRKSNEVVRITAQLIKVENGFHLWSETWDRELKDVFFIQDEIAAIIAEKINKDIQPASSVNDHVAEDPRAMDLYLRGKYLQNKWDYSYKDEIISCYERAINLDPQIINAYVGLSDIYTWLSSTGFFDPVEAFKNIEECIRQGLKVDQENPDIYRIISNKNFWIEWNLPLALHNINKALEGKPSFPDALIQKGLILAALGNIEEALDNMFQALRLNPYSDSTNYTIGMIYHSIGDHEKAIEYINKNIQINPGWDAQYYTKFLALCSLTKYNEAWELMKWVETSTHTSLILNNLKGYFYACTGKHDEALEFIKQVEKNDHELKNIGPVHTIFLSQVYLLLGNHTKALKYLTYGINHNASPFLFIKIDVFWDELRNDPEFIKATQKITFPNDIYLKNTTVKKYKKTGITRKQMAEVEKKLKHLMLTNKPYLNSTLTLYDLAEYLNISTNLLSQILNEHIGKNFYDYVNSFRLNHFLELKKMSGYSHYTLLGLAYECGFNSKSTFNNFFRKTMNMTPSAYFKQ